MKILVTGGLGFIGSHTVVELQQGGYEVIIIDDLSNTTSDVLQKITEITGIMPEFVELDLKIKTDVDEFFASNSNLSGVIHFAASKAVGESVQEPLKYYNNNISALVYVLQAMQKNEISNFIFSSSCTVYGQADLMPITESAPFKPAESPYGNTKKIGEEIISDTCKATNFEAIALRYFNPIGAHETAIIGELPIGVPQNLIPYVTQTAAGIRKELAVFGGDYPTKDGTAVRDYIHVVDLAQAHLVALERLINNKNIEPYEIFNIGTGKPSTVLEVIHSFEEATNIALNYKIVERREGDIIEAYADTQLANKVLGWTAKHNLKEALSSAWKWQLSLQK